ncbi:Sec63 complex subunit SEC66 [Sporobolomyces salmoneus]|uniref:Sec63 complex subunit SEC66 n=1 Tax=Sporobolomyces salmoneus TaxID=183962 RepID=UPI00317522F2
MVSILFPIAYLVALVGSLSIFSKILRKRQQNKPAAEPWFPQHKSRDIYVSLLSLDPPPPRPILVAALLRRAMDDVKLIWSIRDAKASLTTLLQRGQIGDELWERFLAAEKELEGEIVEVVGEANTFEPGYGQRIFAMASEMVSHERWKEVYQNINKRRAEENAKLSSGGPESLVLAPTPYLTPSSLTLAPSNPLPLTGTSPAPSASLKAPEPLAPLPNDLTAPPSRESTPAPETVSSPVKSPKKAPLVATTPSSTPSKASVSPKNLDDSDRFEEIATDSTKPLAPPVPASPSTTNNGTPAVTPVTTPKKTPNKKGKKKPAVKGGR